MNKQYSLVPIGYFTISTLLLATTITCGFPRTSQTYLCDELNKVSEDSLLEKSQNYISMGDALNFNFTKTASGTAQASVSPSMEFIETDIS